MRPNLCAEAFWAGRERSETRNVRHTRDSSVGSAGRH